MILTLFERVRFSLILALFFGGFLSVALMRCFFFFCYAGSFGSLKKRVIFITRSNDHFFSRGGPSVESSVCMCICLCLSDSMNRNYNDTQQWDARSLTLKHSLASSSRAHLLSRLLTLTFIRVVTALVLCSFCFFCFKNQSFISWESFFSFFVGVMQFL